MMSMQGYQAAPQISATVRSISDVERQAFGSVIRPMKLNAIGIAIVSMVMAIMVNFVTDQWMVVVPIFFGLAALGMSIQTRKSAGKIAGALARGNVVDVRAAMVSKGPGGSWNFGAFSVPRSNALSTLLVDGTPATFTIVPESKHMLSVNYSLLKRPIQFNAMPGFESLLGVSPPAQTYAQPPIMPMTQNLPPPPPPPPDNWSQRFCPQCGQSLPGGAMFCSKCGYRLRV